MCTCNNGNPLILETTVYSNLFYVSEGIIPSPLTLSSGRAVCPITINEAGDYVFDFTINGACQSGATDTLYLRSFIRVNGVNPTTIDNYIHVTILPKQSGLGTLLSCTHNHKVKVLNLVVGDIISFWNIGDVNMLGASMIYSKVG